MEILLYNDLNSTSLEKQFAKVIDALRRGDFATADVKKMPQTGYYRAKLDKENRLLFRFGTYQDKTYLFVLEVIQHHAYDKSRFLGGAAVDENKLQPLPSSAKIPAEEILTVPYVNERQRHFHVLDKILSFDEDQEAVFHAPPPIVIIGSAGSGKTALTLEKIKQLRGAILYVTLSPYLVENAQQLYYAHNYDNEQQEVDFLSFRDYLGGIDLPKGRELTFRDFAQWIWRYQQTYKIKDAYKVFEEFKGVLTGSMIDRPHLSREEYLGLGVRQSVFTPAEREQLYELFQKYLEWLKEGAFYDTNIAAFKRLDRVKPHYDFAVVDEVQDITNVQLYLILRALKNPMHFVLCGDSNQIVHPNFFSWSNVKSMFYRQDLKGDLTRILYANYRNTPEVTHIANQLLRVKNTRFGSIDKESTYLVRATSANRGEVEFYEDKPQVKQDLDRRTAKSARFAVLVMRNEDKAAARKFFHTPLLFSVQEAKGLEYENIILYNFISDNEAEFRELCRGVTPADLEGDLNYARGRDKGDKSLDEFKFYVNSLYVAITRAVKNLYVVEGARKHDLLQLLGLINFRDKVGVKDQTSTAEEWQREARRLDMQGKKEQADDIRRQILQVQQPPWEVVTPEKFEKLKADALDPDSYNKKAKDILYEYALMYYETSLFPQLIALKYRKAESWEHDGIGRIERKYNDFFSDNLNSVQSQVRKYGPDYRTEFNLTPLMMATLGGSLKIIDFLLKLGGDTRLRDNLGRTAFQIALLKSFQDERYATKVLEKVYYRLQPGSLLVKIGNRLVRLNNHLMEYFMLNYMIALLREITTFKIKFSVPGFETADFLAALEHYPDRVMPAYRKRRPYLSSILSKNEIFRDDPYNRQLFLRIRHGFYIINPLLEVEWEGGWRDIYDVTGVSGLEQSGDPAAKHFASYVRGVREKLQAGAQKKEAE